MFIEKRIYELEEDEVVGAGLDVIKTDTAAMKAANPKPQAYICTATAFWSKFGFPSISKSVRQLLGRLCLQVQRPAASSGVAVIIAIRQSKEIRTFFMLDTSSLLMSYGGDFCKG